MTSKSHNFFVQILKYVRVKEDIRLFIDIPLKRKRKRKHAKYWNKYKWNSKNWYHASCFATGEKTRKKINSQHFVSFFFSLLKMHYQFIFSYFKTLFVSTLLQIFATMAKNFDIFNLGEFTAIPSIVIPSLTGISKHLNPDETIRVSGDETSWLCKLCFLQFSKLESVDANVVCTHIQYLLVCL